MVSQMDAGKSSYRLHNERVIIAIINSDDLYQLLAYTVAADLPGGMLIYAHGQQEERQFQVVNLGRILETVALNLDQEPDGVLADVDRIARRIRNQRAQVIRS